MNTDLLLNNIQSIQLNDGSTLNMSNNKLNMSNNKLKEDNSLKFGSNNNNFIPESLINFSLNQNEFPPLSSSTKDQLNYNSIFNGFSTESTKSTINQDCLLSEKSIINQNQILEDINLLKEKRSSIFNSNHNLLKEKTLPDTISLINNLSDTQTSFNDFQNLILDLKWTTRDIIIFYLNRFTSILNGKTLNDGLKNKLIKDNQQMINTLTNLKLRTKINQYNESIDQFNTTNANGLNNEIYLNFDYALRTSSINQLIKNQDLITMNSELFTNELKKSVIFENNSLIQKLLGLPIGYVVNETEIDSTNCLDNNFNINLDSNLDDIKKDINQLYDLYENHVINKEEIDTYAKKFGVKIVNLESKLKDLDLLKKEIIEIKFNLNISTLNSNQNTHNFGQSNLDQSNLGQKNFFRQQNVDQGFNLENFDLHKFGFSNFDLNQNLNESKIDQHNFNFLNMDQQNSSNKEHHIFNSNIIQQNLNESNLNMTKLNEQNLNMTKLNEQNLNMTKSNEQDLNMTKSNEQNLSELLIRNNIDFRFDLDNINEFLDSNFISQCSQPFEIGNYSFQLGFIISKLKDNGKLIKGMEIFLKRENDPNDDSYCKVINCELIIISRIIGKDKTIKLSNLEFTYKKTFHPISDKFNKYISIDELKRPENGFINNDIMSIGINLDVA